MSSPPGFQGSTPARLLTLVKLMLNSDQIPSVITAEQMQGTRVFQIQKATSPAGWSQLQKVQQTPAPPPPNTLIKGARRAWAPAVLTLGTFFKAPFDVCMGQSIWVGACMFISRVLWEGLLEPRWQGLLPLSRAALAVLSLHSSCLRFQPWPAAHEPPQTPPRGLLLLPQLQAQDKFPEQMHLFPQNS